MLSIYNLVVIIIICVFYVLSKFLSPKSIPKGSKPLFGPKTWPLIGDLLSFTGPLCIHLYEVGKQYGPLFKFTMGCREIVIINSHKILTKTMKDMGKAFSGRWQNIIVQNSGHNSGVLFKDKEWWATQRSFVLRVLKDFGLGKQQANEIIDQECSILLKEIEETCDKVVSAKQLFPKSIVNVIAKLVMNMRFEKEENKFIIFTRLIEKIVQNTNKVVTLILMYPVLEKLPLLAQFLLWCVGRDQEVNTQHDFIIEIVNDHKKRFNIENEGEDLIDIFLKEQYKLEQENVKNHTFTDWQLIRVSLELFLAGYETTSTTLSWSMLMLAKHQHIQEKMHQEIIDVIGSNRMPNLTDKKLLPYTQAVMDEILRYSSVVPLAIPHRVFDDVVVEGIYIPKDSIVFPNLYACHRDKDVWEKPFEFYPEHFLTTSENGDIKYLPREELVPFGIGKRQCLGEALARTEYFIFLTNIVQRFKIRFEKEINEKTFNKITSGTDGTIRAPLNTDVIFEKRSFI